MARVANTVPRDVEPPAGITGGARLDAQSARATPDARDELSALIGDEPRIETASHPRALSAVDRHTHRPTLMRPHEKTGRLVARRAHRADAKQHELEPRRRGRERYLAITVTVNVRSGGSDSTLRRYTSVSVTVPAAATRNS